MSSKEEMRGAVAYAIWDEASKLVIALADECLEYRRAVKSGVPDTDFPHRVWAIIGDKKDKIEELLKRLERLNATHIG